MTPLTAMRGYLETLAMSELQLDAPTRERYLGIVEQETRRLEHIVGDLLDLARLEGGGSALRREFVDVGALFERVAARHERELTERDVDLASRVDPAARVVGDPDRLEQALQNLAANALRHTPDGGKITLSAEPADQRVRLTVRDTGRASRPSTCRRYSTGSTRRTWHARRAAADSACRSSRPSSNVMAAQSACATKAARCSKYSCRVRRGVMAPGSVQRAGLHGPP